MYTEVEDSNPANDREFIGPTPRTAEAPHEARADTYRPRTFLRLLSPTATEAAEFRARSLDAGLTPGFDDDGNPVLYARDGTYRYPGTDPFAHARRVAVGQVLGRTRASIDREIRDGVGYITVTLIQPRGRNAHNKTIRAEAVRAFFARSLDLHRSASVPAGQEDEADRRLMQLLNLTPHEKDCIRRVRSLAFVLDSDRERRSAAGDIVQVEVSR